MSRYCTKCGAVNDDTSQYCASCQAPLSPISGYQPMQSVNQGASGAMIDWKAMGGDKKIVAGIVAILLGAFGIHKFLLGYTTEGIIMLAITIVSCGLLAIVPSVVGIIEGIMYLTKSDEEFVRTYIQGRMGLF
jgi:TM2 domain-containing membrane protein YozV